MCHKAVSIANENWTHSYRFSRELADNYTTRGIYMKYKQLRSGFKLALPESDNRFARSANI